MLYLVYVLFTTVTVFIIFLVKSFKQYYFVQMYYLFVNVILIQLKQNESKFPLQNYYFLNIYVKQQTSIDIVMKCYTEALRFLK